MSKRAVPPVVTTVTRRGVPTPIGVANLLIFLRLAGSNSDAYSHLDAAGAKMVSLYNYPAEGPGVMLIFDVPDPEMAPALMAVAFAGGAVQNVKLTRLLTQDELKSIQQKARQLRAAYKPPGK